jgi:translation elongation factor EF-4
MRGIFGCRRLMSTVRYRPQDNALDLTLFDPARIRNFCIVSHVDHGKSTLTQRMLNATGAVAVEKGSAQSLFTDQLEVMCFVCTVVLLLKKSFFFCQVERDRGITVHASSASLVWKVRRKRKAFVCVCFVI